MLAVAAPIALLADSVPARFMLPVIIPAANHDALLGPDDLSTDSEAGANQALVRRRRLEGSVPYIRDVTRKQRPGFTPIGALVVLDLARPLRVAEISLISPLGVVADP